MAAAHPTVDEVWRLLAEIPDPEIPVISLVDLGVIRDVEWNAETLIVGVSPTYTGCPATSVIHFDIERRLRERGVEALRIERRLSPPWTTDWIRPEAREKLNAYGIAPPVEGPAPDPRTQGAPRRHDRSAAARGLSALRIDANRKDQFLRLDPVQGEFPLRGVPRTVRIFQVHLKTPEQRPMARFHPLDVIDVRRETRDAVVVTLKPRDADVASFDFTQGQYLTFRRDFDGQELRRSYSICAGKDEGALRVAIKRVDGGAFSSWANQELKAGAVLEAMPPMGKFHVALAPEAARHYLGFAGGSGITPVLSILKTALALEPKSRFTLVYANRSVGSMMFREELEDLKNLYLGRLSVLHVLEDEFAGGRAFQRPGRRRKMQDAV